MSFILHYLDYFSIITCSNLNLKAVKLLHFYVKKQTKKYILPKIGGICNFR